MLPHRLSGRPSLCENSIHNRSPKSCVGTRSPCTSLNYFPAAFPSSKSLGGRRPGRIRIALYCGNRSLHKKRNLVHVPSG
jgi:hypothetical protein